MNNRQEETREQDEQQRPLAAAEAEERPLEGSGASTSAGPVDSEIEVLRAELEETRDRLLRQAAEFQNFRRRTLQERETLTELGKSVVVQRVLEVLDDLERSVEAAAEMEKQEDAGPAYQSLKHGVELVHRKLLEELNRLGVERVDAVGRPFNEDEHEALFQQPAPDNSEPGVVLAEIQKGYKMGSRVLRHSKVIVSQ